MTSRQIGLHKLNSFIENGLAKYSSKRNFDFGPINRTNISTLSPFIRKRILHETEVIKHCLNKYPYQKIEKFIQEIFWRVYWKGWLEGRPIVWTNYKKNLEKINESYLGIKNEKYIQAINGKTGIECFDEWVNELKKEGYLHNHTRMWFASIWIHTLNLQWELGADFFLKHLLDGDPASNTLSWRWVAGLHTKGKMYLADENNIKKFTLDRFKPQKKLNKFPKISEFEFFEFNDKTYNNEIPINKDDVILLSINNLSYLEENFQIIESSKVCLINETNSFSELQKKFNQESINDYLIFLKSKSIDCNVFKNYKDFIDFYKKTKLKKIFSFYPSIGYELDHLVNEAKQNNLQIKFIYDSLDKLCWKFCSAGFFKFKSRIPKIINKLITNFHY